MFTRCPVQGALLKRHERTETALPVFELGLNGLWPHTGSNFAQCGGCQGHTRCRRGLCSLSLLYPPRATSPSTVDRHLSCFQLLPVTSKAAVTRLNVSLGGSTPFLRFRMRELAGAQELCVTSSGGCYQTDFPSSLGESLLLPNLVSH